MPKIFHEFEGPGAQAHLRSGLSPNELVPLIADHPLQDYFRNRGIFPAATKVTGQNGPWRIPGQSRIIHLSDGGKAHETLQEFETGRLVNEIHFSGIFNLLVKSVTDELYAYERFGLTEVRWTWYMRPRPGRGLLVRLIFAPLWRRYMYWSMQHVIDAIEAGRNVPAYRL